MALYACLPYERCLRNHRLHHRAPGSCHDPDVLAGAGPLAWYGRFMAGYLAAGQMAALLASWAACLLFAWPHSTTPGVAVGLVCILPLVLSSLQLFAFGTYLPHRGLGWPWGLTTRPAALICRSGYRSWPAITSATTESTINRQVCPGLPCLPSDGPKHRVAAWPLSLAPAKMVR